MRTVCIRRISGDRALNHRVPRFEALEARTLLAISQPSWMAMGPAPLSLTGNISVPGGYASGAIAAVATVPNNPNIEFIGAVNGGIWKTTNATASPPTWTPLFQEAPSLSISALTVSLVPNAGYSIYAGTGSVSNLGGEGTGGDGIYESRDGGDNWTVLGEKVFRGLTIRDIVVQGGTLYVAAGAPGQGGGVYESTTDGSTWVELSGKGKLPDPRAMGNRGPGVDQLVADPGRPGTLIAAISGSPGDGRSNGIYVTPDGGKTWMARKSGLPDLARAVRIRLAASAGTFDSTPYDVLYAAIGYKGPNGVTKGVPTRVFRSMNDGKTWTQMAIPGAGQGGANTGGQQNSNLALAVDPTNPYVVYVAGDVVPKYLPSVVVDGQKLGGGWLGTVFRGDASKPLNQQWTSIVAGKAPVIPAGGPHADSRNMAFTPDGSLLLTGDGGLYRLSNPSGAQQATPTWVSENGNLQITEFSSIAYDSLNQIILGGSQDNGTPVENAAGSRAYTDSIGGDGGAVAVAVASAPGQSIRYGSSQNFQDLTRTQYNDSNREISRERAGQRLDGKPMENEDDFSFVHPFALNGVVSDRLLTGTTDGTMLESFNNGDDFKKVGTVDDAPTSVVAGGQANGEDQPGVAWVGTAGAAKDSPKLFVREPGRPAFKAVTTYKGAAPAAIAENPYNWRQIWVVDMKGAVYRGTLDAGGVRFARMTGNLPMTAVTGLRSIVLVPNPATKSISDVLTGTTEGVWATQTPTGGEKTSWIPFGGLPVVYVPGLAYSATDNVLVAGTLGRGAWEITNVSQYLGRPVPALNVNDPTTGTGFATTYTQGAGPVAAVPSSLSLSYQGNIASVQAQLAGRADGSNELLAIAQPQGNVDWSYDANTGVLTISGPNSASYFQDALQHLTYNDTAASVTAGSRVLKFRVNDGTDNTTPVTTTVTVAGAPGAPAVDPVGSDTTAATATFTGGQPAAPIAPGLTVTDSGASTLTGAVAVLTNRQDANDESLAVNTAGTNITASYQPSSGTLVLSGNDTAADYQSVLDTLTYDDTSTDPVAGTREVSVVASDANHTGVAAVIPVDVLPVAPAPSFDPTRPLRIRPVAQGQGAGRNDGTSLSALLLGRHGLSGLSNPGGAELGIAVTNADNSHGRWQYRVMESGDPDADADAGDSGSGWVDIREVSLGSALGLVANPDVSVRFVPDPGFSGAAALTFRLWDDSGPFPPGEPNSSGHYLDATTGGGYSPVSAEESSIRVDVRAR